MIYLATSGMCKWGLCVKVMCFNWGRKTIHLRIIWAHFKSQKSSVSNICGCCWKEILTHGFDSNWYLSAFLYVLPHPIFNRKKPGPSKGHIRESVACFISNLCLETNFSSCCYSLAKLLFWGHVCYFCNGYKSKVIQGMGNLGACWMLVLLGCFELVPGEHSGHWQCTGLLAIWLGGQVVDVLLQESLLLCSGFPNIWYCTDIWRERTVPYPLYFPSSMGLIPYRWKKLYMRIPFYKEDGKPAGATPGNPLLLGEKQVTVGQNLREASSTPSGGMGRDNQVTFLKGSWLES